MNPGYLIRIVGVFIIWSFNGFKGEFKEIESKYHNYNHLVGFIFLGLLGYLIFELTNSFYR